MLFSRWLARTTKRTLCSPTSTVPHAILPSHEGPSPPPSPRRSVKDVLTTPRKGCHETEHVLLSRAKPRAGRALLSCLCSGGFIPPSSFSCTGAARLRPVCAGSMPSRAGAAIKPFACVSMIAALQVWQSTRAGRLREKTPWTLLPRCPTLLPLKAARARPSAPVLSFADSEALQPPFYSREESGASCRTQRGEPRHSPLSHRLSRAEHGPVARLVHTPAPPCYP